MPDQSTACFHRWFALEAVSRGAADPVMLTDYDVRNCGFKTEDVARDPVMFYDKGHVPCAVSVWGPGAKSLVQLLLTTAEKFSKEAFIEDSTLFQHVRPRFPSRDVVREGAAWLDRAKLVHMQ